MHTTFTAEILNLPLSSIQPAFKTWMIVGLIRLTHIARGKYTFNLFIGLSTCTEPPVCTCICLFLIVGSLPLPYMAWTKVSTRVLMMTSWRGFEDFDTYTYQDLLIIIGEIQGGKGDYLGLKKSNLGHHSLMHVGFLLRINAGLLRIENEVQNGSY